MARPGPPFLTQAMLLGTLAAACTSSAAPAAPVYPAIEVARLAPQLALAEGVTTLNLPCVSVEVDNGVDDDCDGHIDEPFAGASGELEIAVTWSGAAGLELTTDPVLDAQPRSSCAPRGACVTRLVSRELAPDSTLSVHLRLPGDAQDAAPVTASVSVAAQVTSLGAHNLTLSPGESREVARITVP